MPIPDFLDSPPPGESLTDYDERHHATYWRLLNADAQKADWKEVVRIVFGVEPENDPARSRTLYDAHLSRARWISQSGYRTLIGQ